MKDWLLLAIVCIAWSGALTVDALYASETPDAPIYEDPESSSTDAPFTTDEEAKALILPIASQCGQLNTWLGVAEEKFGEVGVASGEIHVRNLQTGQINTGDLYMFVNPETTAFTVFFVLVDQDLACVIGAGEGLGPYKADIETFIEEEQISF